MSPRSPWGPLLWLAFAAGCGAGIETEAPPTLVDRLRIVAIHVDPPAAAPGESVTLTPLVADPLGGGRALTFAWAGCVTGGAGAVVGLDPATCASAPDAPIALGDQATLTYAIPAEAGELAGNLDLTDPTGTLALPVRLTVSAGAEAEIAIASVGVPLDATPNTNPVLEELQVNGAAAAAAEPIPVSVGVPLTLRAIFPDSSAESYTVVAQGSGTSVQKVEVLRLSWFSSVGEFEPDFTSATGPDTVFTVAEGAGSAATLWAVLDDGRGGVTFLEQPLAIQ